jgi:DNA ligase (NAD+)
MKSNIEVLVEKLVQADNAYYNNSTSLISDEIHDTLKDQLRKVDPKNPYLKKIGAAVPKTSKWNKRTHKINMYSLNKVNTTEEFQKWFGDVSTSPGDELVLEEKLDGISIDLEYKDGNLVHATTRGDSEVGEDIFLNVRKMKNVRMGLGSFTGNLRGEIVIFADDFEALNKLEHFENARNAASGISKRFNHEHSEFLTVLYYDVHSDDLNFDTEWDKLEFLSDGNELQTVPCHLVSMKDAIRIYNEYVADKRANVKYDIDGLVIKLNDLREQHRHGLLGGNPKAQTAWKFPAMTKEAKVADCIWQLGRSGKITSVAILEPTRIGGVTVTRASLHNLEMFKNYNLGSGDTVILSRRNDVIPYVESVKTRTNSKRFSVPDICPKCGAKTMEEAKFLVCYNLNCSGAAIGDILKWLDKSGISSLGLARKTIEKLFEAELVKTPADLYRLTVEQVETMEGQGHRSAEKIVEAIQSKREISLANFIGGLNIRGNFSSEMTQLLIDSGYDTIEKLIRLAGRQDRELMTAVKGIGNVMAEAFWAGMKDKDEIIQDLLTVVKITGKETKKEVPKMSNKLSGSFCFTGKVLREDENGERWTREMLWDLVAQNGGEVAKEITKSTTYLVQADVTSTSSKSQKAKKLGVALLSERDFFKMLGM